MQGKPPDKRQRQFLYEGIGGDVKSPGAYVQACQ